MATRVVRDGMLTSERIDSLSPLAELFYRRLQQVVDDHGRYFANPKLIRSATFPLRTDTVSLEDVGAWVDECVSAGLVTLYTVDSTSYLTVENFGQRIQSKSKFPDPPESTVPHGDSPGKTAIGVVVVGVEDVGVVQPAKKRRAAKTPLPADFQISDRVRRWAAEKGFRNLERHFEHFVSKAKSKGYEYADWDEGFMGAIREDWAKVGNAPASLPRLRA